MLNNTKEREIKGTKEEKNKERRQERETQTRGGQAAKGLIDESSYEQRKEKKSNYNSKVLNQNFRNQYVTG